ncbi:DoxX family membrane protein [Candidatus Latescibacterota bacterium]
MNNTPSVQSKSLHPYGSLQLLSLVVLRLLIGWHFLYEGFAKVFNANWTAAGFLLDSKWIFSKIFVFMAEDPTILTIVNFSNKWGLIFIGLGLMTGTLTRISSLAGIFLLGLYYFATPPFIGYTYSVPMEGSYLIVNKNMIEAMALLVLILFPTGHIIGLDRLIFVKKSVKQ